MKLFPNPITSPSRLDKFQSPLKRSLRKNGVGSRSRGRSRSSPMFIRKKNEVLVETQQEPSSPKVTCFGQVRVRKSKSGRHNKHRCCCCCCCSIRKALCCSSRFDGKSKPSRSFRSVWERWFLFGRVGFRSKRRESIQTIQEVTEEEEEEDEESDEEEEEENTEEDEEVGGGGRRVISSSPPKNALLLMRSKSESYRPSSLANLFWGSPVSVKDSEEIRIPEIITEQRSDEEEEEENEERPTSEKELTCRDSTSESRKNDSKIEKKLGLCDEIENSSSFRSSTTTTNIRSSSKIEDESGRNPVQAPALPNTVMLRRSKSEPASRGISVKLDSLENWKEEIYNKLDPSSIHQTRKEEEKEGRDSLY